MQRLALIWEVGFHKNRDDEPEEWIAAQVPGAVQLDWASDKGWPPYWKGDHFRDYAWMEDVYWTYRAQINADIPSPTERLILVCGGVDYRFQVVASGQVLHDQEGMFTPFEVDLTAHAGSEVRLTVFPAPKSTANPTRDQANRSCKPAVSYGWDFHPRLIPLGIWEETWLELRPSAYLDRVETDYRLAGDFSQAEVILNLAWTGKPGGSIRWTVLDPAGEACFEREGNAGLSSLSAIVEAPQLWWTHDQGKPALYRSEVEWLDDNGETVRVCHQAIGFRRVRLVMAEGAWEKPDQFPKSRSNPPITLELNGRRIFCRGSNLVNPEVFPGSVDNGTYRELLRLARDANWNLLRCWGGAGINKESFFDLCDELGILIWQEFPLACNLYPDDEAYLRVLDQESRSIIRRLKGHPSVALWCAGNELFNVWSGMTDQSLPIRLLNRNCYDLDPERPFLPTSPIMGMGHGHYVFRDPGNGQEAFEVFQKASATAYTEFGCPGPASVETLESFLPPEDLFPPRPGTAWESHHALGAWMPESHLYINVIEYYCGPSGTLAELVEKGQLLQAEGYKGLFEEARRQKPVSSMALNWCLNEPWPCAANNSLLCWPAQPKPAYFAVSAACRPVLASARICKFLWKEGDIFDPEIWLLSDAPVPVAPGRLEAWLHGGEEKLSLLNWDFSEIPPNENLAGPRARIVLPPWQSGRITLHLRVVDRPELNSEYHLVYHGALRRESSDAPRIMNL